MPSLEELWDSAPPSGASFSPDRVARLPETGRRYLQHAIAPGTALATAVRLRMHGEIKLKRWLPFTADQVISWSRGMIWRARVSLHGLPISGFDRLDEQTFGGYTIPTRLRVGWYVGSPQFESAGEFSRVTIDDARYR